MVVTQRLSRWSMAYFTCAFVNFLFAGLWVVGGNAYPLQPPGPPGTLIALHLVTIGWITLLMLGALAQFVPVITAKPLPSQKVALVCLVLIECGLASMVAGFLALGGTIPFPLRLFLPLGGTLVVSGVLPMALNVGIPLLNTRLKSLPARMVFVGLGFLFATVSLGLCFAVALGLPKAAEHVGPLLPSGVRVHVVGGFGGWFLLTAVGVSYKLLPMFMLAPEERGWLGESIFGLLTGGVALAWFAWLASVWWPGAVLENTAAVGLLFIAAGLVLYLADMVRLYRTRQRRKLELNSIAAVGALTVLGLCVPLVLAASLYRPSLYEPTAFLFLVGYASGLALSQLYKIVPFLTWLERFGGRLGKGPVPRVQDLVVERRAAPWFGLYFLSVIAASGLAAAGAKLGTRLTLYAAVLSVFGIGLELWRVRYPGEAEPMPMTPVRQFASEDGQDE